MTYGKIKKCMTKKEIAVLTNSLQLSHRNYEWIWIVIIASLTAISSEIKLLPFEHINFRFGLGSIIFLLLLLIRPTERVVRTGIVTGIVVVLFRTGIDVSVRGEELVASFISNAPTFVFYMVYAIGYRLLRMDKHKERAITLGLLAVITEIIANSGEHAVRFLFSHQLIDVQGWLLVIAVACFRSFFVIGIYFSIAQAYGQRQLTTDLTVNANVYMETLYLKKLMDHVEQVMAHSYTLYRELKKQDHPTHQQALHIAQEIHEVKKDSQRIYAGINKITVDMAQTAKLSQLLQHVRNSNENYAEHLGKSCTIHIAQDADLVVGEAIAVLTILNNIVANAVEAMKRGNIYLSVTIGEAVLFRIEDEGQGIDERDLALIFEPGFTTKYNQAGVAATGIGLSHVRDLVQRLGGEVNCVPLKTGTSFTITLPKSRIEE